jgi:hypothetical protein
LLSILKTAKVQRIRHIEILQKYKKEKVVIYIISIGYWLLLIATLLPSPWIWDPMLEHFELLEHEFTCARLWLLLLPWWWWCANAFVVVAAVVISATASVAIAIIANTFVFILYSFNSEKYKIYSLITSWLYHSTTNILVNLFWFLLENNV